MTSPEPAGGGLPGADHVLARSVVLALGSIGWTLATAESVTGGMLAAWITEVPGASAVFRGGVVPYATDLKGTLLGVDPELLAAEGAVHPEVARQMAAGVRRRSGADVGVATTGVAGPAAVGGRPIGQVWVAVADPSGTVVIDAGAAGSRSDIRRAGCRSALLALHGRIAGHGVP
jgi:nicotinamide-nucleotide amidase